MSDCVSFRTKSHGVGDGHRAALDGKTFINPALAGDVFDSMRQEPSKAANPVATSMEASAGLARDKKPDAL
jgi:hypothetical protein